MCTLRRILWVGLSGVLALIAAGCASEPLLNNPVLVRPDPTVKVDNPVWVHPGVRPTSYHIVFDKVLDIVSDYFEIADTNRYGGQIETFPRIAPGLEQPWKPGSPDFNERLLASMQTIRHRAFVLIQPANDGGYFIDVKVFKELEDLPRPTRSLRRRRCLPQRQHDRKTV